MLIRDLIEFGFAGEAKITSTPTTQAQVTYVSESVLSSKFDAKTFITCAKKVDSNAEGALGQRQDSTDNILKERRLMRSLEKVVGGRLYEGDLRRLQRTI
ncbi:hypothetical protein Tco_1430757 [Tanacetum coccineum]